VSFGRVRTTERISGTSIIEVTSTTRRSHESGFDSFRVNRPVAGSISSRRWIVFASKPVVWVSLFAAPGRGARQALQALARTIIRIVTSVGLAFALPPVITVARFASIFAWGMAARVW
jgi:hypothetical protein